MPGGTELKLFESPSKIKQFTECELLGQLSYNERWEPREAHASLPARLRGNAFARACEGLHGAIRDGAVDLLGTTEFVALTVDKAIELFDKQFKYCVEKGIVFKPDTDSISKAELRRVIPLYAHHTPLKNWVITHVEDPIKSYSCRPDLAGKEPAQQFDFVGDMKYKSSLDSRWENDTIEEFHWDIQFQQYPEAHRSHISLSPDVPVYSYLFLVIGTPFRIKPVGWIFTPEQQQFCKAGITAMTKRIQEITIDGRMPIPSTSHRNKFGWCPMKKACLEYNLDAERMKRDYVQLDELPE